MNSARRISVLSAAMLILSANAHAQNSRTDNEIPNESLSRCSILPTSPFPELDRARCLITYFAQSDAIELTDSIRVGCLAQPSGPAQDLDRALCLVDAYREKIVFITRIRNALNAVVRISVEMVDTDRLSYVTRGTGFIYRRDATHYYILTDYHVIRAHIEKFTWRNDSIIPQTRPTEIVIYFPDGRPSRYAETLGYDVALDLIVLRVELDESMRAVDPLRLGDSDKVKSGDDALVWAHMPYLPNTRHETHVGTTRQTFDNELAHYIQLQDNVGKGCSGAPVLNSSGEVIAIIQWTYPGFGISYTPHLALPINTVKSLLRRMEQGEKIKHASLAVAPLDWRDVTPLIRKRYSVPTMLPGLVIMRVVSNSFAEGMGLLPGDVIIAIDGTPVSSKADLFDTLVTKRSLETVNVTIVRSGSEQTLPVKLTPLK